MAVIPVESEKRGMGMFRTVIGLLVIFFVASSSSRAEKPNVIVVMADDLGWNHVGVSESTCGTAPTMYQTPNVSRLASEGVSFPFAYAQPNCAPTRAAMLTGQYAPRRNNDIYVVGNLNRYGRGGISKEKAKFKGPQQHEDVGVDAITIAESLKENGYITAHIGKYHVGGHDGPETLPENSGFDINIGGFSQGHQPVCFASRDGKQWKFKNLGRGDFDRWAEPYGMAYLKKRELPESLLGTPKHVSDAFGDAMEETIQELASRSEPFYLQLHTYAVHGPVKARPDLKDNAASRNGAKKMAEYLGFIAGIDENVGRLLAVLDDPNFDGNRQDSILENTLILFTSDNGGTHTDNLPLRGEKGMFTEGGIRVPLIAFWKGHLPEGRVSQRMVHAVDYYPTCLELAGKEWMPPSDVHPLDGESFLKELLQPGSDDDRGPVYYLFPGYLDKRAQPGAWVINEVDGNRFKASFDYEEDEWSLFNLSEDVGEEKNLATENKKVLVTLAKQLDDWLVKKEPTWQPKYPIRKEDGVSAGKPPRP